MSDVSKRIDEKIGEVRTESLDMSFGEITSLHAENELVIQPEYQRLFRWSEEQSSRLIESVLLGLPVPQLFVIENENGVLELIDGLQRVSSIIHFVDPEKLGYEPLVLSGCDLIQELNGNTYQDLPLVLQLRIKRTAVRMVVIKRQSRSFLRYEMFKRLNTGGEILAPQEIRNCSARMVGDIGTRFYEFLQKCAGDEDFKTCTEPLSESDKERKGDEELVLRFFALKNHRGEFRGSVRDWLDNYMESVLLERAQFDYEHERRVFSDLFAFLSEAMGTGAFVKYRGDAPIGALAPAYFEAVAMGTFEGLPSLDAKYGPVVKKSVIELVQTNEFREVTGPGANARWKMAKRIEIVAEKLKEKVS